MEVQVDIGHYIAISEGDLEALAQEILKAIEDFLLDSDEYPLLYELADAIEASRD